MRNSFLLCYCLLSITWMSTYMGCLGSNRTPNHPQRPNPPGHDPLLPTPAFFALIEAGDADGLLAALKTGTNANATDQEGNTGAMLAAQKQSGTMFRELVRFGANPDLENKAGKKALDFLSDKRSLEQIRDELAPFELQGSLTEKEKQEQSHLLQLSLIRRYAQVANFVVPARFVVVPNLGAGSCFFLSIGPMLAEIYHDPKYATDQKAVRDLLANYLTKPNATFGGTAIAEYIDILKAGEGAVFYGDVHSAAELADRITNSGKFAGQNFWGDDFTDGLAKEMARLTVIKVQQDRFGNGKDIFYCQSNVDTQFVGFLKYHLDIHFEAMSLGNQFAFDKNSGPPQEVKDMINAYNLNCKVFP